MAVDFPHSPGGIAYRLTQVEATLPKKADAEDVKTVAQSVQSLQKVVIGFFTATTTIAISAALLFIANHA